MLDKDTEITIIDSLSNVTDKTDEELKALLDELGLSSSPLFLREVYKCLSAEAIAPSYELLCFFDAIFCASRTDAKNVKITEISTEDKEVARTFLDVCEKTAYVRQDTTLSPLDILNVSSEYLNTLSVRAPKTVGTGQDFSISDENGSVLVSLGFDEEELRYGYVKKNASAKQENENDKYLPEGTDIFLVSATSEDYDRLAENGEFCNLKVADTTIDKKGLLYSVLRLCLGAEVSIDAHPLQSLVTDFCGERIVAVKNDCFDKLAELGEEYGIAFTKVATSLKIPTAKIITPDGEINIRAGFLRRIFSFDEKICVKISSEQISPTKYEKLFYDNTTKKHEFYDAIEVKNHIVSARKTSQLSFGNGINTVLDSLFALLAAGADRRKAGINIKMSVCRENLEDGISAILGAYRAVMELCLPQINSEFVFSDENYIICTAFAPKVKDALNMNTADTSCEGNSLYLLSFKRFDNSLPRYMPDFEGIRKMCDRLYSAISDGTILSVRAVNGTVYEVVKDNFVPSVDGGINEDTVAQGFVVEVKPNTKINAPLIGIIKSGDCENKNTEENV